MVSTNWTSGQSPGLTRSMRDEMMSTQGLVTGSDMSGEIDDTVTVTHGPGHWGGGGDSQWMVSVMDGTDNCGYCGTGTGEVVCLVTVCLTGTQYDTLYTITQAPTLINCF